MSKAKNPVISSIEEITVTLRRDEDQTLKIKNPNGAQISCTVKSGSGEVSVFKNGTRLVELANTYFLSVDPGLPTSVRLNTSTLSPDGNWELYIVAGSEHDKNTFKLKLLPKEI